MNIPTTKLIPVHILFTFSPSISDLLLISLAVQSAFVPMLLVLSCSRQIQTELKLCRTSVVKLTMKTRFCNGHSHATKGYMLLSISSSTAWFF